MKRWYPFHFGIASLLLIHLPSMADLVAKKEPTEICIRHPSRFQVGGSYTWASIHPHGFTSFEGGLGGVQGIYEYHPLDQFYGGVQLSWREGSTHASSGRRSLMYIDAQERLGYTFGGNRQKAAVTLFSGLGYRYLGQSFYPSTHLSPVRFRYNEIYVPVGLLFDYLVSCWCSLGFNLTWEPQIYPTVKIVPLEGARWIIKNQLGNFSVELPITFIFSKQKRWSVMIKPFYEKWRDGASTAKTADGVALGLPANTYNFWGIDLNFGYSF